MKRGAKNEREENRQKMKRCRKEKEKRRRKMKRLSDHANCESQENAKKTGFVWELKKRKME